MDVTILLIIAGAISILIFILMFLIRRYIETQEKILNNPEPVVQAQQVRRAVGVRNVRHRAHANTNNQVNQDADDTEETNQQVQLPDHKIGAKKRAKLNAKAEKKIQREAAEHEREIRKKQEEERQKEKDRQHELEVAEELRQEEAERKTKEEQERKEYEEYLKMKEAFSVEEEGYAEENEQDEKSLLTEFIEYIKQEKVVFLDSLAERFSLKTESVVKRILELQASNELSGVIDDRGKFIYISESELEAVKKFVFQRGRVSITELAENSSKLINLTSLSTSASIVDTA